MCAMKKQISLLNYLPSPQGAISNIHVTSAVASPSKENPLRICPSRQRSNARHFTGRSKSTIARRAQRPHGLRAAVVELGRLADDDGPGAQDEDALQSVRLGIDRYSRPRPHCRGSR
jgi:hypothetical protein